MTIVVLGSINIDLVAEVPRLPSRGETLRSSRFYRVPGGKGANQAVAAARQGAAVRLVGRVGDDEFGRALIAGLRSEEIDIDGVAVDGSVPTGTALISVADGGENTIVTVGGANHAVGDDELRFLESVIDDAWILLVQLEIPLEVVREGVAIAGRAGVPVLLDPAPVTDLPDAMLTGVAWITPNVRETEVLTGIAPLTEVDAKLAAEALRGRGIAHVAITLGGEGCFYSGIEGSFAVAAPSVSVIDTVASGDAFNGSLAAALDSGDDVGSALRRACAAGALAATRPGAQPSLPTRADVDELLSRPS